MMEIWARVQETAVQGLRLNPMAEKEDASKGGHWAPSKALSQRATKASDGHRASHVGPQPSEQAGRPGRTALCQAVPELWKQCLRSG